MYKWNIGSNLDEADDSICLANNAQQQYLLQQHMIQQQQQQQQLLASERSDATLNSKIANLSILMQQIDTAHKQRRNSIMARSQRDQQQPDMPPPASIGNISDIHTDIFASSAHNNNSNNRPRWL